MGQSQPNLKPKHQRRYSFAAAYLAATVAVTVSATAPATVTAVNQNNMLSSSSAMALSRRSFGVSALRRSSCRSFVGSLASSSSLSSSSAAAFVTGRRAVASHGIPIRPTALLSSSATESSSSATSSQTPPSPSSNDITHNGNGATYQRVPPNYHDSQYDLQNRQTGLANTSYDPSSFESSIYSWWETAGCFDPDAKHAFQSSSSHKPPYVLPMPPPNVTGRLHMGHAIFVALQDVLARFHRMRGRPVLWTPGTDHAGIATQLQVEKALAAEGKKRGTDAEIAAARNGNDEKELARLVGREEFLTRVWEYKEEQGGAITSQLRSLGASADWTRERFTMDPALSVGVTEAFCRLYEKGLVYRGTYMVNWSPGLMTAVSDLEVEYTEEEGKLYYFKYLVDGDDGETQEYLPVATTRPETIFGDTAVCVNPEDERYRHLVGKRVIVPLSGKSSFEKDSPAKNYRTIPVIADDYVDMSFGTGALKITPGHDPNDYELGKTHDLPILTIMNKDATMTSTCGDDYAGLDRFAARDQLWKDMEEEGLTIKVEKHMQRVPRSQRGGEVIEPLVSQQWFVKTEGMGKKALEAVKNGEIEIVPRRFEKVWDGWLTDIRDW